MSHVDVAILGAGAMGSILGAHLMRAGHSVALIARGRRAADLEANGLRVTGLSTIMLPIQPLTDPTQLRSAKLLIVGTKALGTAAALEPLKKADIGVALSVQNGVMKNELLADAFGADHVLGALANFSGELLPNGEAMFTRNVALLVGELAPRGSPASAQPIVSHRAQDVAQLIEASGVHSRAVPNIESQEWSKFAGWAGLVALSVTLRSTTGKYLSDAGASLVLVRVIREIELLARAAHIALTDEALFPVATFGRIPEEEAVRTLQAIGADYLKNAPRHRLSTLQDLEANRPLEIEETLGFAVRRAVELNVPTPLLQAFYHLASAIDRARPQ